MGTMLVSINKETVINWLKGWYQLVKEFLKESQYM